MPKGPSNADKNGSSANKEANDKCDPRKSLNMFEPHDFKNDQAKAPMQKNMNVGATTQQTNGGQQGKDNFYQGPNLLFDF